MIIVSLTSNGSLVLDNYYRFFNLIGQLIKMDAVSRKPESIIKVFKILMVKMVAIKNYIKIMNTKVWPD